MSDAPNTLFLRLEGPLQAWGGNSKFVIRRTMEAPTKSGVIGLICCAMGVRRGAASRHPIPEPFGELRHLAVRLLPGPEDSDGRPRRTILCLLNTLKVGVRIDRAGTRWWDYHTVGAGYGILTAQGVIKKTASTGEYETLITRREYLCDASFLLAVQGDPELIRYVKEALEEPKWPLFLGRKSCPPSVPILGSRKRLTGSREADIGRFHSIEQALMSRPWHPRFKSDKPRDKRGNPLKATRLDCLVEWRPHDLDPGEVWYDAPVSFDPPVHEPRLVRRTEIEAPVNEPFQYHAPPPPRLRADYGSEAFKTIRRKRLDLDYHLCVFCKSPLTKYTATVQHVTYRHAGKEDYLAALRDETLAKQRLDELRSLCRLCHDAVTMIEYGLGMGLDRINPEDGRWREQIIRKRAEIIAFRSLETRRRRLQPEEVE